MTDKANGAGDDSRREQLRHLLLDAVEKSQPSIAQTRAWFLHQFEGRSNASVIQAAFGLTGAIEKESLERALGGVVARHESLRTKFVDRGGEPGAADRA